MNSKRTINWKLFLVPLFTMLFGMVMGGCSDDKDELQGSQYGYNSRFTSQHPMYKRRKTNRIRQPVLQL